MHANSRIKRESRTVSAMIACYCKKHHGKGCLCPECEELAGYALSRLKTCRFQEGKTVCSRCPVHCYRPEMREKIRKVMKFSGPRMIYLHPLMALSHLYDKRRKEPVNK